MDKSNSKKIILTVLLIYTVLSLIFFGVALIKNSIIAFEDSWLYYYPLKLYYSSILTNGLHLWMPYEFLGLPFLGTLQSGLLYPLNFFYFIFPAPAVFNISLMIHYIFAAFFTFMYVRLIGVRPFPAFLAGILFGFSGFMMAHKNHISMINAVVWFPLILYLYEKIKITLNWKYCLLAAFVIAVQIYAGHFHICVLTYMVIGFFTFFHFVQNRNFKFALLSTLPVILGLLIAMPQLLATYELSTHTLRAGLGYEVFTEYSYPPYMLINLIFPFFFGRGFDFWGSGNVHEMSGFIGILPLALAILAFIKYKKTDKQILFWGIVAILSFLLVFGGYNPLYKIMYYVPGYNLFRVPARNWFEFDFAAIVLFSIGLNYLLYHMEDRVKFIKQLIFSMILTFILGFIFIMAIFPYKIAHNITFIIIPAFLLTGYVVSLSLFNYKKISFKILLSLLSIVIILEAFSFGAFINMDWIKAFNGKDIYWHKISETQEFLNNPGFEFIKSKAGNDRIVYLNSYIVPLFNISARINTLNGYDPFISTDLYNITGIDSTGIYEYWNKLIENNNIFNMLSIRYLVIDKHYHDNYGLIVSQINRINSSETVYKKVFEKDNIIIYENRNYLPKVFSIEEIQYIDNIKSIRDKLLNKVINPENTALIYEADYKKLKNTKFTKGRINIERYNTDVIHIKTDFTTDGFIILTDLYYPGWKAFIDNTETPIYKTNGLLRGIAIPAGKHYVTFRYIPTNLYISAILSITTILICITALLIGLFRKK